MKFNTLKYKKIQISEAKDPEWEDDFEDFYRSSYDKYGTYGRDFYDDAPDVNEPSEQDEGDNLAYEIRQILKGYGINSEVDFEGKYGLTIRVNLQKREKMANIMKIMDTIVNKVKRDILPQYESEVELYETTKGQPVLEFDFYMLGDSNTDKDAPF
jgi:hypothetical protein